MRRFLEVLKDVYVAVVLMLFAVVFLFITAVLLLLTGSWWTLLGFFLTVPLFVAMCIYADERWG